MSKKIIKLKKSLMENQNNEIRHYFNLNYRISNNLAGGISFNVSLIVDTNTKKIIGKGNITQAVNPPLNIPTILSGDYSYMCTMNSCNILVVMEGVSPYAPLILGAPQPIQNVKLRMSLEDDWKSGTATYSFLLDGKWVDVGYQKVELVELSDELNVDKLSSFVKEQNLETSL